MIVMKILQMIYCCCGPLLAAEIVTELASTVAGVIVGEGAGA